jgi:D-aspartate ligase
MAMKTENGRPGAIIIEGHVQGLSLTRSLGETGIPVYVVDKDNCIARYSRFAKKFFKCPDYKEDAFADFLVTLAQKEQLNGWVLFPSNDHAVITLSRNKHKLEPYFKMLVPVFDQIEVIYNKVNLLNLAAKSDIPIPDTFCFTDTDVNKIPLQFPVITKGKHGLNFYKSLKTKVFIAHDKQELKSQLEYIQSHFDISDTFTQTIIKSDFTNKTVSFTAFCIRGEIKTFWIGRKLREHPVEFGTATFAESIYEEEVSELSKILLHHLNYTGVCEIEFLKDPQDNKFKLIEINARTWLWVGLAKACGINYALYIYNYLNGEQNIYPLSYTVSLKWRNAVTDFFYSLVAIRKGLLSLKQYFKQTKGKIISALFYRGDNIPVLAYFLLIFSFVKKRTHKNII